MELVWVQTAFMRFRARAIGGGGFCCEHGNTFLVPFKLRNFFNERAAVVEVSCSEMSESA